MQISETENNGILIVAAEGRLDSNTSEAFSQQLLGKIDAGNHKIILELSQLEYISSAGLRVLLMAAKRLKAENGGFAICGVEKHIREVFEISGFLQILNIENSMESAQKAVA